MNPLWVLSLGLLLVALVRSAFALHRLRDWRMGFLTGMIALIFLQRFALFLAYRRVWDADLDLGIHSLLEVAVSLTANVAVAFLARFVADHRRTGLALAEGEQRLFQFLEAIPTGVFAADAQGHPYYVNQAGRALLGQGLIPGAAAADLARGYNLFVAGAADVYPTDRLPIVRALAGETFSVDDMEIDRAGRRIPVQGTAVPVRDADGRITHAVVAFDDISARRESEARIRREMQFSESLIAALPSAFYMFDACGRILRVNENVLKLSGYTAQEIDGMHPRDFIAPEHRPRLDAVIDTVVREGQATLEVDLISRDGRRTPHFFSAVRIAMEDGPRIIGIGLDITKRRRAEQELRASETRFKAMIERNSDGITLLDREGRALYESPRVDTMFGRPPGFSLIGRDNFRLVHPDDRDRVRATFAEIVRTPGATLRFECRAPHADGHYLWVEAVGTNMLDDPAIGAVIVNYTDITERRQAEARHRLLEDQLRQAQKMDSIGQLAGGIAHDFNNLLVVISGYTQIVADALPPESPLRRDVREIRKAGDRAALLIRQLLAFSRRQVLNSQVLNLNTVLDDVGRMLARLIGEHVRIHTDCAADLGRIKADLGQLEQVVVNLAINARDAMPQGGVLTLATRNAELDAAAVEGLDLPPGRYVVLSVADTGCGMDPDIQARIFEPFFTTKGKNEGTGLGLSTVYGIVKQSGGAVTVRSAPGAGSTFEIFLPRIDQPVDETPRHATPLNGNGHSGVILVAEDEDDLRLLTARLLRSFGYDVIDVPDGASALAVAEDNERPIDLLLTDLVMPGMNGRELAVSFTALRPDTKVLYTTGYSEDSRHCRDLAERRLPVLQKPFDPGQLSRKVAEVLHN